MSSSQPKRSSGKRPPRRKTPTQYMRKKAKLSQPVQPVDVPDEPEKGSTPEPGPSVKKDLRSEEKPQVREEWSGYRIIDTDYFFKQLLECALCAVCGENGLELIEVKTFGLGSAYEVQCGHCGTLKKIETSARVDWYPKAWEINRRVAYAANAVSLSKSGLNKFCAFMDLPPPLSQPSHDKILDMINSATFEEAEKNMKEAAAEEAEKTGSSRIKASRDGTWQTRGHSSKNGVVSVIGIETGKVFGVEIMSTKCHGCSRYGSQLSGEEYDVWWESHKSKCAINHKGTAGSMEAEGIKKIFKQTVERAGVMIEKYIGDGDSRAFKAVIEECPYGPENQPKKVECTGHVQKRMGTRLRNLKQDLKGKKLDDGKTIGGRGRLPDKKCDQIATYYGNAIRSSNTVEEMKHKIWAIYHHYRSTDENPEHQNCPEGENSWCHYRKAEAKGTLANVSHKGRTIPVAIMDKVKPVFEALTADDLLNRCVGAYTQNANESFNAIIWKNVQKTVSCSRQTVETAVYNAVLTFNSGQKAHINNSKRIGVAPGKKFLRWCEWKDSLRMKQARTRAESATKEARIAKRRAQKQRQEDLRSKEGPTYVAGGFD